MQFQWLVQLVGDFKQTTSPNRINNLQKNLTAATQKDKMQGTF